MSKAQSFFSATDRMNFRAALLRWYDGEKRTLPWRGESDPYRILVSEVMLQQTRVAVVEERYKQFLRQFPTARRLARASQEAVLAAWSGLGYYRRARNLHNAAQHAATNGGFPRTSQELMELPGVGRYTAAAVASIAFGEAAAVVDGNVTRVLERVTARELAGEDCWLAATELLDTRRSGDFNQAMMELGAMICVPGRPACDRCPVHTMCASRGPTTRKKPERRRKATVSYGLAVRGGQVFLQKRASHLSLMPGMWELPMMERAQASPLLRLMHSITTTDYSVLVFEGGARKCKDGKWVRLSSVRSLPLTGLTRKILRKSGLMD